MFSSFMASAGSVFFLFSYFQSAWVFCRNLVIVKVDVMAAITALFPTNVEVVRMVAVCVSAAAPA